MQIGLSLCLGANLRSGGASFSPASLFSDGDGALIQRSDDAYFTDQYATTQAVDANTVGFATDVSEGAGYAAGAWSGLGPELSQDSWILSGSWSETLDSIVFDGPDRGYAYLSLSSISAQQHYVVELDIIQPSLGTSAYLGMSGVPAPHIDVVFGAGASGPKRAIFLSGNAAEFLIRKIEDGTMEVAKDALVKHLPGRHLTQSTASYRPTLTATGLSFDGSDDRLTNLRPPTTSGTIAARFNGSTASRVIFGSQAASDGRCFLALDASGKIAAGIGAQGTSTIAGGADIRGAWHTAAVTWDGSTVTLYLDGVSVYSAAQSGAVNTTVAMMLGALNANGTAAAFWAGTVSDALVIDRVLTTDEITNLNTYWSA